MAKKWNSMSQREKESFCRKHYGLVRTAMRRNVRISQADIRYEDALSEANEAFFRACATFDDSKGILFENWALFLMRQAIRSIFAKENFIIHGESLFKLTENKLDEFSSASDLYRYILDYFRNKSVNLTGIHLEKIKLFAESTYSTLESSIDKTVQTTDGDDSLAITIEDPDILSDPAEQYSVKETRQMIIDAVNMLPDETDKKIAILFFLHEKKLREIDESVKTGINTLRTWIYTGPNSIKAQLFILVAYSFGITDEMINTLPDSTDRQIASLWLRDKKEQIEIAKITGIKLNEIKNRLHEIESKLYNAAWTILERDYLN